MKRFALAASMAWTLLAGAAQAAEIPDTPEPGTIRMGTVPWLGYGQWHIAAEKGYFKEFGLDDVQQVTVNSLPEMFAAFSSGSIDVVNTSTNGALLLSTLTDDAKAVFLLDFSLKADAIIAGEGIDSIADLKGKPIAYEEGDVSDVLLNYALKSHNLSIADITKVPMSPAQAGTAVIAGQAPVGVTYEPYLTAALNQDDKVKIIYSAGEDPGLISDVLLVRQKMLEEKPGQVLALLKAWDKSLAFYQEHTEEGRAIIAKAVGASPEELANAFDGVQFYSVAENAKHLADTYYKVTLPKVQDGMIGAKLLESRLDTSTLMDFRFVEAAAR